MSYLIQITVSVTVGMHLPYGERTSKENQMLCSLSIVALGQDLSLTILFSDARNVASFSSTL